MSLPLAEPSRTLQAVKGLQSDPARLQQWPLASLWRVMVTAAPKGTPPKLLTAGWITSLLC